MLSSVRRGEPAGGEGRQRRSAMREAVDRQPAALERERLVEHGGEEEEGFFFNPNNIFKQRVFLSFHLDVVEVMSSSLIIPKPNVSFSILTCSQSVGVFP